MGEDKPGYQVAADGHVYHKSATANASVAPTNEHTIKNAADVEGLSVEQTDFVTVCNYEYGVKGELPTIEFLRTEYGYTEPEAKSLYQDPTVIKKLTDRGITIHGKHLEAVGVYEEGTTKKPKSKLTPLQLIAANTLLDLVDTRSEKKKLQDLGVSSKQYQTWLRDPEFSGYLKDRAEGMLGDVQHEAMLSLMDNVRRGDMKAISMYLEMTGRFVAASSQNTGGNVHDLQNIIIRIIEIIVDEVEDPQTASRISDRLKGLVAGATVAGVLPAPEPIVVPETAKARELTPKVQEMMAKGVGYDS